MASGKRGLFSMKIRTLIVDDEPLARRSLATLLEIEPDFEVVGECADGAAAVTAIDTSHPDLVFLDVEMPTLNGFEVLDTMKPEQRPALVFVTAHDQFAVRAFDINAVDYLLKPFRRERFLATLERVRQWITERSSGTQVTRSAIAALTSDRMTVKSGDRLLFIDLSDLEFIRAAANYVRLQVGTETYDVREGITNVHASLPQERFLRIHRSYIVNLTSLKEIYPVGGGEYMIALRSGRQLPVGPSYVATIRRAIADAPMPHVGGAR
jgi:two-component system LytT family response regulator